MRIGAAFPDHIKTEKLNRRRKNDDSIALRPQILITLLALFSLLIILKLVNIQLIHGSYYRQLSDSNRTKTNVLYPQRGIIFDRNGVPLVINLPDFEKINTDEGSDNRSESGLKLLADKQKLLRQTPKRYYPLKDITAHVIGYVGKISPEELPLIEGAKLKTQDYIGKSGIEKFYDKPLRGTYGKELVEVDALGNSIRTLGTSDPIAGSDMYLTLDSNLQKTADEALPVNKKGAVIVSTPDGEILAMVSKPAFDPNLFTMGEDYIATESAYKTVNRVLEDDQNQPLMNRAINGEYPPGSTFKLITAAAGLERKVITSRYVVEDTGIIKIGEFSFGNWYFLDYGKTDGMVDVVKGISRSNDIFFYKLAEKISVDTLSAVSHQFGLGNKLGIDLPGERKGLVPTKKWKKEVIGESWYLGDTYHYGIGQGYLLTTPLQVNNWTASIANGGTVFQPHLFKKSNINPPAGGQKSKILSDRTVELIRQGMINSCRPGGVAWPLFQFKIQNSKFKIDGKNFLAATTGTDSAALKEYREVSIACKTGTAQHGGDEAQPHAWITLFAPAYNPQIVVTVLVESAGQGSDIAAPVAKKILEFWFGS